MRDFDDYDDPNSEYNRRFERDLEREPHRPSRVAPRLKQCRYWSGVSFRPARPEIDRTEEAGRAS
jgi:hypothetical protein